MCPRCLFPVRELFLPHHGCSPPCAPEGVSCHSRAEVQVVRGLLLTHPGCSPPYALWGVSCQSEAGARVCPAPSSCCISLDVGAPAHFLWPLFGACPGMCLPSCHRRGGPYSAVCVGSCDGGALGLAFKNPSPRPATYCWPAPLWAAARGRLSAGQKLTSLAGENPFAAPPPNRCATVHGLNKARRLGAGAPLPNWLQCCALVQ